MVMGERPAVNFGTMMKRAREARGISLRQIATATKISVAALEALERNDISRLPGGLFSRSFVRSYALEIGLDPEETVRDFIEQFPHDSVTQGSPHVPQEDHEAIESERNVAETALKLIAISVPIAAAILYFTRATPPRAATSQALSSTAVAAAAAAEPLTFELAFIAPVTITLDVDGVPGEERMMSAGERLAFRVERDVSLRMSDASAVQLTINGRPASPLGRAGEPRVVQIDRANYSSFLNR